MSGLALQLIREAKAKKLKTLNLGSCGLTELPPELFALAWLEELVVSNQQWDEEKEKFIKPNPGEPNRLAELPMEIGRLKQLKKLDVSGRYDNRWEINDISPLQNLASLEHLDFSYNQVSDISPIEFLEKITQLKFENNRVKNLKPLIHLLSKGYPVKQSLEYDEKGICLHANPLCIPPPEIAELGAEAILSYFEHPHSPLNEAKVILVGEGASGKTSLIKALLGEAFDEHEDQTHGVRIRRELVPINEEKVTIHFWDFGGQEIMYATHQFFLSKRSVYVLVLDSRKDEKAEYWLKRIQSFGGESPTIVVLNKIDQHPSFRANEQFLQEKYPFICEFVRLSCKSGEGVEALRQQLWAKAWDLPMREAQLPDKWHGTKRAFEEMKEDCRSCPQPWPATARAKNRSSPSASANAYGTNWRSAKSRACPPNGWPAPKMTPPGRRSPTGWKRPSRPCKRKNNGKRGAGPYHKLTES